MTSHAIDLDRTARRCAPASLPSRLLSTDAGLAPVVLRLGLAGVILPHGAQKLLGWFGGYGWEGTMGFLTGTVGLPWALAAGVILLEFFGPLLLLAGLATRAVALGLAGLMVGAIATVHVQHGFFMDWSGAQGGQGYEYHLLVIAMALALALRGGGSLSVDRRVSVS